MINNYSLDLLINKSPHILSRVKEFDKAEGLIGSLVFGDLQRKLILETIFLIEVSTQ
jgi:hypothetical protein